MNTKILKTLLTLLIALSVGVVFSACVTDDEDAQPDGFCNISQDATPGVGTPCSAAVSTCQDGLLCFVAGDDDAGICVRGCADDSACGDNIECVQVNNSGNTGGTSTGGTSTGGTSTGGTSTGGTSTGGTSTGGTSTGGTSTGGTSTGGTSTGGTGGTADGVNCEAGQQCADATGNGDFQCVENGAVPANTQSCGANGECPANFTCYGLDPNDPNVTGCLANCEGVPVTNDCPDGRQCADVTGQSNFQCVENGGVPADTQSCGANGECPANFTCYGLDPNDPNVTGCLENCGGGGGPVGGSGCGDLLNCLGACEDDACAQSCGAAADQEAIDLYNDLFDCFDANCAEDQSQECAEANCGAELNACGSD